jgi:TRAP-type C4-dicarboxylate transport system permease small subunit
VHRARADPFSRSLHWYAPRIGIPCKRAWHGRSPTLAVVLWIGAYALISGVLLIGLAFRLRSWERTHTPHAAHSPA